MKLSIILCCLLSSGCSTFTNQGFYEKIKTVEWTEPDENGDQYVKSTTVAKVKLTDFIVAAPWKGKAGTDHSISYTSNGNGWTITFGGTNDLEGGDVSEAIAAAEKALLSGALESLTGGVL